MTDIPANGEYVPIPDDLDVTHLMVSGIMSNTTTFNTVVETADGQIHSDYTSVLDVEFVTVDGTVHHLMLPVQVLIPLLGAMEHVLAQAFGAPKSSDISIPDTPDEITWKRDEHGN